METAVRLRVPVSEETLAGPGPHASADLLELGRIQLFPESEEGKTLMLQSKSSSKAFFFFFSFSRRTGYDSGSWESPCVHSSLTRKAKGDDSKEKKTP